MSKNTSAMDDSKKFGDKVLALDVYTLRILNAHHSAVGVLNEKLLLLSKSMPFGITDEIVLNSSLLGYVDNAITLLEFIGENISKDIGSVRSFSHTFLREWRNKNHHETYTPFQPVGMVGYAPNFLLWPVMQKVEKLKRMPQARIVSTATLSDLIERHHAFLNMQLSDASNKLRTEMQRRGIGVRYQVPYPMSALGGGSICSSGDFWSAAEEGL